MKLSLISGLLLTSLLSSTALGWADSAPGDSISDTPGRRGLDLVDSNHKTAYDVHKLVPRDPRRPAKRGYSRGALRRSRAREDKAAKAKKHQLDASHRSGRQYVTQGAHDNGNEELDFDAQRWRNHATTSWQRSRLARRPAGDEDFDNDPVEESST